MHENSYGTTADGSRRTVTWLNERQRPCARARSEQCVNARRGVRQATAAFAEKSKEALPLDRFVHGQASKRARTLMCATTVRPPSLGRQGRSGAHNVPEGS